MNRCACRRWGDSPLKFVDEISIVVRGGHGGAGHVSFHREKYQPNGGPSGGDGGRGGNVILRASSNEQNLGRLLRRRSYAAEDGLPGKDDHRSGRGGVDLDIPVPVGTHAYDTRTGEPLGDLVHPDDRITVAVGGRGGLGNSHFATSVRQAPDYAQPGEPGQEFHITLELKLLADAGLVGPPNAGKSTLLNALSRAHARTADYPFTTLTPNLGVIENEELRRLLLADIPGIIEGASRGAGLGLSFLRHIERVRMILYVIDIGDVHAEDSLKMLRDELAQYSPRLLERPALVIVNKLDLADYDEDFAGSFIAELRSSELWQGSVPEFVTISALDGRGLNELKERMFSYFPEATFAEVIRAPARPDGDPGQPAIADTDNPSSGPALDSEPKA